MGDVGVTSFCVGGTIVRLQSITNLKFKVHTIQKALNAVWFTWTTCLFNDAPRCVSFFQCISLPILLKKRLANVILTDEPTNFLPL